MSYDPHDHLLRRSDIAAGFGIWLAVLACISVCIDSLPGASPPARAYSSARSLSASVVQPPAVIAPVKVLSEPVGRADRERGPADAALGLRREPRGVATLTANDVCQ